MGCIMLTETITLKIPELLYRRLQNTAQSTRRPLDEVIIHALQIGSPPVWDDVPAEFQADLAVMDRLDDDALWQIARSYKTEAEMERYDELLEKSGTGGLTAVEAQELQQLRQETDRFMLQKAHAAALLRWRGHTVPIKWCHYLIRADSNGQITLLGMRPASISLG